MKGFYTNINETALNNSNFRQVLYTGQHSQLVLMSLKPGEEIGSEVHSDNDQFFQFEAGTGTVVVDDISYDVTDRNLVLVPAGAQHNIINTSESEDLKMYTIYSPAHHKDGVVRATKADAEADGPEFDGVTTE